MVPLPTPLSAPVRRSNHSIREIRQRISVSVILLSAGLSLSACTTRHAEPPHALVLRHAPAPILVPAGRELAAAESHAARDPACFALTGAGTSMAPLYANGTAVVVREQSYITLRPGMPVVYRHRRGHYVAHALLEYRRGGWVARGVNNPEPDDELVTAENFVGVIKAAYASADTPFRAELAGRLALHAEADRKTRTASLP